MRGLSRNHTIGGSRIVFLGLTITSSWGNGHATTYRGLIRELARRKHDVLFLERDAPWYSANRDLPEPPYGRTMIYGSLSELRDRFAADVRSADLVVVGSYVPDGIAVGEWVTSTARGVTAFYDIDTPVTLAALAAGTCSYLTPALIPRYDLYLSFTGGPTLKKLERRHGVRMARALYCSFDPAAYHPETRPATWDLGYMGTFCETRQPALERLLVAAARQSPDRRFVIAGPGYPEKDWGPNVARVTHVPACEHRAFYTAQRFPLNLTRADMVRAGYSPSVRLFEAAACGVPIISDYWKGLDTLFTPRSEILISTSAEETLRWLELPERERLQIARRARRRVLAEHTAEHRAIQLERYLADLRTAPTRARVAAPALQPAPVLPAS
jgi:spore maturation protein CgeB